MATSAFARRAAEAGLDAACGGSVFSEVDMERPDKCQNCKQLRELKAENRSLRRRIERLEQAMRQSKRQAHPFARPGKDASAKPKGSPGRKKGEGPFKRREPPPESLLRTVVVPLDCCPECGGPIEDTKHHEQIQSDIPPIEPIHTRFVTESGYCRRC